MQGREFGWRYTAAYAAVIVCLLYWRIPDAFDVPRFWAEDGPVFFEQWRQLGVSSIWQPYAGYLHLVPRLIAAFASLFPLEETAMIYALASLLITTWTSLTIAQTIKGVPGFICGIIPVVIYGSYEVLGTPTNLQWIMAVGLAIIATGSFSSAWVNRAFFVFCAALSGPFSAFFAPIFAVRLYVAIANKRTIEAGLAASAVAFGIIQAFFIITSGSDGSSSLRDLPVTITNLLSHAIGGYSLYVIAGMALLATLGLALGSGWHQRIGLLFAAAAVLGTTALRFSSQAGIFETGEVGHRYWFIPASLIATCFVLMAFERNRLAQAAGITGVAILLFAMPSVDPYDLRRYETSALENWRDLVTDADGSFDYTFPPNWTITVTVE